MKMRKRKWNFEKLVITIRQVHEELAAQAGRAVNVSLTRRNWLIGAYIAEYLTVRGGSGRLRGEPAKRASP